eukprot:TRINITY_DN7426_c0_g1_i1.p1 TRINITY_DN7426_c0_g1~~TRINITY_DN7426_c0_g1_i1.p1  ORF type:complete len:184 (+),score=8.55 TRINITY_DN7426_c0_g1_i1:59-610(+)
MKSLLASCKFSGIQRSEKSSYPVTFEIKHVDTEQCILSGYLTITGLTKDYHVLTTFVEGEIIGHKYSFLTRKWHADEAKDTAHWSKFPGFAQYSHCFNDENFYHNYLDSDFIFMRWKESFLVPDHKVKSIDGASYDGFYYICYQKSTNKITGYYYLSTTPNEMFQSLELRCVPQRSFPAFEFR